jgi:hypothetical protein
MLIWLLRQTRGTSFVARATEAKLPPARRLAIGYVTNMSRSHNNEMTWRDIGRIWSGRDADIPILNSDPRCDLKAPGHIDAMVSRVCTRS